MLQNVNYEDAFARVNKLLLRQYGHDTHAHFLKHLKFAGCQDGIVQLTAPSGFLRDFVSRHYTDGILECCQSELPEDVSSVEISQRSFKRVHGQPEQPLQLEFDDGSNGSGDESNLESKLPPLTCSVDDVTKRTAQLRRHPAIDMAKAPNIKRFNFSKRWESARIIAEVEFQLNVTFELMRSKCRKHYIAHAMACCCFRLRGIGLSLHLIASIFAKDHTTILHAVRRHRERMNGNG